MRTPIFIARVLAVLVLSTGAARATPTFPTVIQQTLGAVSAPACNVCHKGGVTQIGTVTTSFGVAMRDRGLVAYDESSLKTALAKMETDKVDSNGNGVTDIEELKQGKDPNAGAAGTSSTPDIAYGCAVARGAPASPPMEGLALLALLALVRITRAIGSRDRG
jgi:MYXO-CTERM domain-containing protein